MNNINLNVITELCAEDRARIDRLIDFLGQLVPPSYVAQKKAEDDELRKKLEQVVASATPTAAEPAETPQDEAEAATPTDTPAEAETLATVEETKPEVTLEMLKSKVIKLAAKADLKEKVRELVQAYATKVTDIPADKWAEVYMRLDELEG